MRLFFMGGGNQGNSGGGSVTIGSASFAGVQKMGLALVSVLSSTVSKIPGIALSTPVSAVTAETPGIATSNLVSGSPTPAATSGMATSAVASNPTAASDTPAPKIVQITYNLTGTYPASSAANVTVSGSAWTNSGNATGVHNGSSSTHNGAVSAQDAYLNFAFPALTGKTDLTITAATLNFYCVQGGTTLNNGGLTLYRGTVGSEAAVTLLNATGNVDYSATPYSVDLFAAGLTTWASFNNFAARVRGTLAAGATLVTQSVDAVELVITANTTQLP